MKASNIPQKKGTNRCHSQLPRRMLLLCGVLAACTGLAMFIYSPVGMWVYQRQANRRIAEYEMNMQSYQPDELEYLYHLMVQYNQALYLDDQQKLHDPFAYEQVDFSLLDFGYEDELIGHVSVPAIDVMLPVYLGASRDNLNQGAAHLTYTSLPVGGVNTNTVIAGHRGMPTAAMFQDIDKLHVGDLLYFTNFRDTLVYNMVRYEVILPHEVERIMIQKGRDLLTLLTCHPYGGNSHRYVVVFERIR